MKITWQGKDLGDYSGAPRIEECRLIKREIGMLPMDFGEALQNGDPDATSMLVAIMLTRSGEETAWNEVTGELDEFDVEYNAEEKAEMKKQEAARKKAEAAEVDEPGKGGSVTPISSRGSARKRTSGTSTGRSHSTGPGSGSTTD